MQRLAGLLWHPRSTMAALVAAPSFLSAWIIVLAVWLVPAAWLLSTPVGRQAVVDERVRAVEAFGGTVDDAQYDRMKQAPPYLAYFTSGGRLLLAPPVTLAIAGGLVLLARVQGARFAYLAALAVTVHASLVLALQQALTTPLAYLRESLSSPTNLTAVVPGLEDGSLASRLLGAVDVFGVWWIWLLALGVAAATASPARRHAAWLLLVYVGVAAVLAAVMVLRGGS
ncbi:MAG: hypothetical protein IT178_04895 [Acidobacteria bacterium]|nr:hypothetical protein [Acidobacteriota bacterium]